MLVVIKRYFFFFKCKFWVKFFNGFSSISRAGVGFASSPLPPPQVYFLPN